jgi:hypothetical protein
MLQSERAMHLARLQAIYYLVTGIFPLLSMRGFETITGPKTDRWLVKTVGLLLAVIGGTLALASRRGHLAPEMVLLAAGSAGALATIDVAYVAKRRIWPIFLLDAVVETGLVIGWMHLWRQRLGYEAGRTAHPAA